MSLVRSYPEPITETAFSATDWGFICSAAIDARMIDWPFLFFFSLSLLAPLSFAENTIQRSKIGKSWKEGRRLSFGSVRILDLTCIFPFISSYFAQKVNMLLFSFFLFLWELNSTRNSCSTESDSFFYKEIHFKRDDELNEAIRDHNGRHKNFRLAASHFPSASFDSTRQFSVDSTEDWRTAAVASWPNRVNSGKFGSFIDFDSFLLEYLIMCVEIKNMLCLPKLKSRKNI